MGKHMGELVCKSVLRNRSFIVELVCVVFACFEHGPSESRVWECIFSRAVALYDGAMQ